MAVLAGLFDVFPDMLTWILEESTEIVVIRDLSSGKVSPAMTGEDMDNLQNAASTLEERLIAKGCKGVERSPEYQGC